MKAICDRSTLSQWVQAAGSIASVRSPKPALGCLRLEAKGKGMTVLATDLEVGLRVEIGKMEVREEGVALVPADRLGQILRELDADTVEVSSAEQETQLVVPGARFKILGDDPADFPAVPEFPIDRAMEVGADDLRGMIQRTLFATARENTRYALNGVLWDVEGSSLALVATEGHRLSLARGKCKDAPADRLSAIVPSKAMQLVERLLGTVSDGKAMVRVAIGDKDILVSGASDDEAKWTVYSRLVDGHFPKYEDVVPKDLDRKATVGAQALLGAVRKAALLTNEESRGVTLRFEPKELILTSRTPEMGEAEVRIGVEYAGEPMEIVFNPVFLLDALKVVDAEEVQVSMKSSSKPGVLSEGKTFTYVVMPVSVV